LWDIETADIDLLAMHGEMLLDPGRVARLLVSVYGLSSAEAVGVADAVATFVDSVPEPRRGHNPIFTLNAYAFSGEGDPEPFIAAIPDKIVFGYGFIDAFEAMGIGDVGPRVMLAHEFGHHVQYELDVFDSPLTGAEATRRVELMADAYATYFAVHAHGLALNTKRVLDAERTFYEVGDCRFTEAGHHGTPTQHSAPRRGRPVLLRALDRRSNPVLGVLRGALRRQPRRSGGARCLRGFQVAEPRDRKFRSELGVYSPTVFRPSESFHNTTLKVIVVALHSVSGDQVWTTPSGPAD
jgi:hypothetical protein